MNEHLIDAIPGTIALIVAAAAFGVRSLAEKSAKKEISEVVDRFEATGTKILAKLDKVDATMSQMKVDAAGEREKVRALERAVFVA